MKNNCEKRENFFGYFLLIVGLPLCVVCLVVCLVVFDEITSKEKTVAGFTDDGRYYVHYEKDCFFPFGDEDYTNIYEVLSIDGKLFCLKGGKLIGIK